VLYLTIAFVVAAIAVAAWIGAHMWSGRNRTGTQWQPSPYVQAQAANVPPSITASNVNSAGSDTPSTAKSNVRRHKRSHPAAPAPESSGSEGPSDPGTEA